MFTSELGCVTPWIIAPGHYTNSELHNLASHLAIAKKFNAGCNCLNAQAVILPSGWKQKDQFKTILFKHFERTTTDPLYYPGSCNKARDIVDHYSYDADRVTQIRGPNVKRNIDGNDAGFLSPYIIDCGTLLHEVFGPVLALVELPGHDDDGRYLPDTAVAFVNNKDNIFGSLSCSLIFPKKMKDSEVVKETTGLLNYGCVNLNTWGMYGYAAVLSVGSIWGGSIFEPINQSGRGFIGNPYRIEHVEKSVVSNRSLSFPIAIRKNLLPPYLCQMLCTNQNLLSPQGVPF
eukprot:995735_1